MNIDTMKELQKLKGVLLKDGRLFLTGYTQYRDGTYRSRPDLEIILYDHGVQEEDDSGCTLWSWDYIDKIFT